MSAIETDTDTITADELATSLRCSTEKVYRMARAGEIPSMRVGRSWRFDLERVKEALAPKPADPWAQSARSLSRRRVA